jgi:hypothetical protein
MNPPPHIPPLTTYAGAPPRVPLHVAPPVAARRSEADVQWIVGWIRDILVIAMAIANLLHASGGH